MHKTGIDYLKFRCQNTHFQVLEAIRPHFYGEGELLSLGDELPGRDGWKIRRALMLADLQIAWIDYGGDSQRGWLRFDMAGKGCEWVEDWKGLEGLRTALTSAELRRVDVKLDFFDGSVTHDKILEAYQAGAFKRENGGRNPIMKKVETSRVIDGRTVYIGARTSARYIRCYEKGWELVNKAGFPEGWKKPDMQLDFKNGLGYINVADYYRVEVEFKAVDDVVVPWTILGDPDAYFAGAATFCQSLVDASPRRPQAVPTDLMPKATLAANMEHCRMAYGGLFRTLLMMYGDTPEVKAKLFDELSGNKPSERLVREGVLTVNI